jgi:polysaccharide export outer membrane protein
MSVGGAGGGGGAGGASGMARIYEIETENVSLFEVLAKSGIPSPYSYANRIKIIRGNPSNPTIFTIDLTRYNSFVDAPMILQPNDIIYIEPAKRNYLEFLRDITVFSGLLTTILTIYLFTQL